MSASRRRGSVGVGACQWMDGCIHRLSSKQLDPTSTPTLTPTMTQPHPYHQNLIQAIVNELTGVCDTGLPICECRGEDGKRANEILDCALEGFYGSRAVGFWDTA